MLIYLSQIRRHVMCRCKSLEQFFIYYWAEFCFLSSKNLILLSKYPFFIEQKFISYREFKSYPKSSTSYFSVGSIAAVGQAGLKVVENAKKVLDCCKTSLSEAESNLKSANERLRVTNDAKRKLEQVSQMKSSTGNGIKLSAKYFFDSRISYTFYIKHLSEYNIREVSQKIKLILNF